MNPVRKDMELLSNSMATYAHIKGNMESFALYFMLGVCSGLLLALVLLVLGIACRPRLKTKTPASPDKKRLKESSEEEEEDKVQDESEEGDDEDLEVHTVAVGSMTGTIKSVNVFSSEEELERARRLEERERIVREIWRNGQPDILTTGTGTLGRVHYH